ncbi:MAG: pentapeptide repeat-containing protein [Mycobacterium sp.]
MRAATVRVPVFPVWHAWRAGSVAVINDVYGAVQTWIAGLPASPVRDFLHQGVVSVRATALSVVGVRVGETPSCVSTGNCSGKDFSGQDLTPLWAPGVDFSTALFVGTILKYAYLVPSDAVTTLISADLTSADLTGAIMTGANLTNANLTGSNLYLAFLYGATLNGANLTDANLTHANLSWANLTGANLTGANLTEVTWNYTTCPDGKQHQGAQGCGA